MADSRNFKLSVILGVVDNASAGLNGFNKKVQDNKELLQNAGLAMTAFGGSVLYGYAKLIKSASDLEETQSKFNVVFEEQRGLAEEWSDTLVQAYGTSEREAKQFLSATQDLLKPMGIAADKAGLLSNAAVKLAVDMGSFNNMPTADVLADIHSALTGMVIPMKKYGVVLSATAIEQEILTSGMASTKNEITAGMKAQAALTLIMKGSKDAMGDMARTSQSYANQTKFAQAATEDISTSLGNLLLPEATALVSAYTKIARKLDEFIKQNPILMNTLIDTTGGIAGMSLALGGLMLIIPRLMTSVTALFTLLAAHPFVAIAAAIAGVTLAAVNLAAAYVDEKNAAINTLKTRGDRLKAMQEEKAEVENVIKARNQEDSDFSVHQKSMTNTYQENSKYRGLTAEALAARLKGIQFTIAEDELAIEKEKNDMLAQERQQKAEEAQQALIEDLAAREAEMEKHRLAMAEKEKANAEIIRQFREDASKSIRLSWLMMLEDTQNASTDWYKKMQDLNAAFTSSISSGFQSMMINIQDGWSSLAKGMQIIATGMRDAVVKIIADIAAQWAMKHLIMAAITKIWAKQEIAANAGVAASKAAAATAWTLWGSIAIGAAIGAAVIAMAGGFEKGGIVGGNSFTGDMVNARVNSGEMILTRSQQADLFSLINGDSAGRGNSQNRNIIINFENNTIVGAGGISEVAEMIENELMQKLKNEVTL